MTSAQNRLLPLSGNKRLLFVITGLLFAACSPKLHPVANPVKPVDSVPVKRQVITAYVPPPPPPTPVISLLLPFYLDQLDLSPGTSHAGLAKAGMAVEYYQGFKLALDSLSARKRDFKLQVYDTKDEIVQARVLAVNPNVKGGNLVVGPVYPEGLKSYTAASAGSNKLLVSPLSPASPSDYNNPNLVTVIPPLEYHAWRAAAYMNDGLKAKKVFILRSGFSDENKYVTPFKKAIDSLSKKRIKVIMLTVVRGNLGSLIQQLSKTEQNIFVVPGTNPEFVQMVLRSLDTLSKKYPVSTFGHPDWAKATYLKPELLQKLNTYITSSDKVNYHAPAVIKFVKAFRNAYHAEPGEYAIKGFDEGMYFGNLINGYETYPVKLADYDGLHNKFRFQFVKGAGWVNTYVQVLKYSNFDLKPVE